MLVFKNKGFVRKYAYGGRGLFDSIAGLFSRFFSSDAAKAITDIGKKAAKEVGKKALDIGKDAAIKAAPKLIEKGIVQLAAPLNKALTPKAKNILQKYNLQIDPKAVSTQLTTKAQDILGKYDINQLMMGSGRASSPTPIEIQKLVKKMNSGGGM